MGCRRSSMASPMWLSASSVWRSIRNSSVPTGPVISARQLDYAAKDVELLCEMDHPIHQRLLRKVGQSLLNVARCLTAMANTGLPWDRSKLLEVEKDYEKDIENLGREFHLELDETS